MLKFAPIAALLMVAGAATPALADDHAEAAAAFTIDTPIVTLMADEAAKAVVLRHLPGIDEHPQYDGFKSMSLKQVQPFSGGVINDEILAAIATDLAALD